MAEKFLGTNKLDKKPGSYFEHLVRFISDIYHDGRVYFRKTVNFKGAPSYTSLDKVLVLNQDGDITYMAMEVAANSPVTGSADSPSIPIVGAGKDVTIYLAEPETWLAVNFGGVEYRVPCYLPSGSAGHGG